MNIVEWFDPTSAEHLEAFEYLKRHGQWPADFVKEEFLYPSDWPISITNKILNYWTPRIVLLARAGVSTEDIPAKETEESKEI